MKEKQTDILIVGAGLGGVAGALAALRLGKRVILTDDSDWVGGQLTTQLVPPDENPWIDSHQTGCTASYRQLRDGIRNYYRHNYPLNAEIKAQPHFNPGMGNVSPLCHEPRIALAVLQAMLAPYLSTRQLQLLLNHRPISAETDGDYIKAVTLTDDANGESIVIHAPFIIDATELGDLLEFADIEHVIGAESQTQTGELHALPGPPDPLDQQSFSWCFAIDYLPDEDHTIDKPQDYSFWTQYQADFWPAKMLSWTISDPISLEDVYRPIFNTETDNADGSDLWHYRRVAYRKFYPQGFYRSDVVVVNWPQLDYWLGQLVGVSEAEKRKSLTGAQQLSLSLLYWMQTEAPTPEGGHGYPGLRLRSDIAGSTGLAKRPYIREGRRIKAEFTVVEQHVGVEARQGLTGAEEFFDTVGIGSYRIDLHPSYRRNYLDINNWPFQIPLGALLPQRVENLLPANKNIGSTHITNGCYRLHPVEWNIGEAVGALAAHCLSHNLKPRQVRNSPTLLNDFQTVLSTTLGFELSWPEPLRSTSRDKLDPLGM